MVECAQISYENEQMLIDSHDISFSIIQFCLLDGILVCVCVFDNLTNGNEKSSIIYQFERNGIVSMNLNSSIAANDMVIFDWNRALEQTKCKAKVFNEHVDGCNWSWIVNRFNCRFLVGNHSSDSCLFFFMTRNRIFFL